ncbi:MAG: hypothetical protein EB121_06020 [Alphaproteobacteria bacterium]|nr:hypothetical protein [Alphaproteobacteria bacterium]
MAPRKKGTKAIEHQNFELLILSDWHLGSRLCNLDYLIEFLQHNNANTIILLGDIWEELHEYKYKAEKIAVVEQLLLDKLNRGTAFFFLPGNHDFTRAPMPRNLQETAQHENICGAPLPELAMIFYRIPICTSPHAWSWKLTATDISSNMAMLAIV